MSVTINHTLYLRGLTIALFGAFAYLMALPVWDSDFWWHLAAGRHIFETGSIPSTDPFHVFDVENVIRSETVLKGQWLGQVIMYGLYTLAGIDAIVLGRVGVLLGSLYLVYKRLQILRLPTWAVIAVTVLVGFGLCGYTGDRPQLFSILLMALTFWCVDKADQRNSALPYIALPLISLAWAQMHGGVILAWVLLGAFCVLWGWQQYRLGDRFTQRFLLLLGAVAAFGVGTMLTPNGLTTYAYILNLEGSALQGATSEYISSLLIYQLGFVGQQVWIYLALMLSLLGTFGLVRKAPSKAIVLVLLLGISIESYRYFSFLLVAGIPYAAAGGMVLMKGCLSSLGRLSAYADRWGAGLVAMLVLILVAELYHHNVLGISQSRYPMVLAKQIKGQQGKVLSALHWGGYLLWHNPNLTPYLDGRMLDDAKLKPYTHMIWATPAGLHWFQEQRFDWVLMPHRSRQGETYKLNFYLDQHPGWQLFSTSEQGVVFKAVR